MHKTHQLSHESLPGGRPSLGGPSRCGEVTPGLCGHSDSCDLQTFTKRKKNWKKSQSTFSSNGFLLHFYFSVYDICLLGGFINLHVTIKFILFTFWSDKNISVYMLFVEIKKERKSIHLIKALQNNRSSSCPICPFSQGPLTRQPLRDQRGRQVCIWKSEKLKTS